MIGSLIAAFVSGEAGLMAERAKRAAIAYAIVLIFAVLGLSFLLFAGFIQLANMYSPLIAALSMGGAFLLIAIIVMVIHQVRARAEQKRIERKRRTDLASLGATAAVASIPSLLKGRKGGKAAGAAAALLPVVIGVAFALYRRRRDADEDDA